MVIQLAGVSAVTRGEYGIVVDPGRGWLKPEAMLECFGRGRLREHMDDLTIVASHMPHAVINGRLRERWGRNDERSH